MSITYGFFNAVNGDRTYDADDMSNYYDGLVTDGVCEYIGGALEVTAGDDMSVNVATGKGFIDGKYINNDATLNLEIAEAHSVYARIDLVVAYLDTTNRLMDIEVITGTPASTPVAPSCSYECLELAKVNVAAGASTVTVTDTRVYCKSLISTYDNRVNRWTQDITTSADTTSVTISISGYTYKSTDIVDVFVNGFKVLPSVSSAGVITFDDTINSGAEIHISILEPEIVVSSADNVSFPIS